MTERLDVALVARGVFETRAKARAAIESGLVRVDGVTVMKPAAAVAPDAEIAAAAPHPYVSRGGTKLAAAIDAFGVDPTGRICLDIGASTGGFTDVLLQRGAALVIAVDVGRDQLHPRLRGNPLVRVFEGRDARTLTASDLGGHHPDLVVCDVSFIGASKALATPLHLAAPTADLVVLLKPQFECGPDEPRDKRGLIARDRALAIANAAAQALDGLAGFTLQSVRESAIRGGNGAFEAMAWLRR